MSKVINQFGERIELAGSEPAYIHWRNRWMKCKGYVEIHNNIISTRNKEELVGYLNSLRA